MAADASYKPSFLTTVGERKAMEKDNSELAISRLLHYRGEAATRYIWDVPEGVPPEYPENAIFDTGGLGAVEYAGETVPIQGRPVLYGALGEPLRWIPKVAGAFENAELLRERSASEAPYVLIDQEPMAEKLWYYCQVQARAWNALKRNLLTMVGPVVVQTVTGGELKALKMEESIRDGDEVIKELAGAGTDAKVLDLGGQDHTQNLITTINQMDAEILSLLGIPALGTSKTSGITAEEAGSIASEMRILLERGLRMREYACKKINKKTGLKLSVRINPDLQVPGPGFDDRTDGLTDNQREREARKEEAAE